MPDYKEGKIYKIKCNETGEQYFGSTTYSLQSRLNNHKSKIKSKKQCMAKQIINRGNFQIELVENYSCETSHELHKRERFYIDNNECINHVIPTRTQKEYRQLHKEKFNECNRIWLKEHRQERNTWQNNYYKTNEDYREKSKVRASEYYEQNKKKILERMLVRYVCCCGAEGSVSNKLRHEKTQRHQKFINQTSLI